MFARRALFALLLTAAVLATVGRGAAQVLSGPSPELGQPPEQHAPKVEIDEHLGGRVDPSLQFTDSEGRAVRLGDYLGQGRPVLLTLSYHNCQMLCSYVLDGVVKAVAQLKLHAGEDFEVVNVSFDPRDTPAVAARVKARYVAEVADQQPDIAAHWHFLTGPAETSRALADELGFGYVWDDRTQQYAHAAVLMFLGPDGTITRYLYGIDYSARDVRLATVEAGQGEVGTPVDQLLLTCFHFDPDARSYTPVILNIMKLGGGLLLLAIAAVMVPLWLRERRRPERFPEDLGPLAAEVDE